VRHVEAFRASDGQLFETAELCQEHEVSMVLRSRIGGFVASDFFPYSKERSPVVYGRENYSRVGGLQRVAQR
jgi:hypothetical protein